VKYLLNILVFNTDPPLHTAELTVVVKPLYTLTVIGQDVR